MRMMSRMALAGMAALMLASCGGGGSSSSVPTPVEVSGPPVTAADNVVALTIDDGGSHVTSSGSTPSVTNVMYTTVTVCMPGTTTCTTVDHVQVDTGSSGLRLMASVLPSGFNLPQRSSGGTPVVECTQFADGYSWGPLRTADVQIGGETAASVPIQTIGDSAYTGANNALVPSTCSSTGRAENTPPTFGANGILGVSPGLQDCGTGCANNTNNGFYYLCSQPASCSRAALSTAEQVQNAVALFANDNNGILIDLPTVPASGATVVHGNLIFGIGTRSNNSLPNTAKVYQLSTGSTVFPFTFNVNYNSVNYPDSFMDSGTSAYVLPNSGVGAIPRCNGSSDFLCPSTTLTSTITLSAQNSVSGSYDINIANADRLFNANPFFTAFDGLAIPSPGTSTMGLGGPFFFGRPIYTAFEGFASVPGTSVTPPLVAF